MDSSTFNESQTQFSVFTNPSANWNDQPVNYGPLVFKVMDAVGKRLGGAEYLIGRTDIDIRPGICLTPKFATGDVRFKLAECERSDDRQARGILTIHLGGRTGRISSWKCGCSCGRSSQRAARSLSDVTAG